MTEPAFVYETTITTTPATRPVTNRMDFETSDPFV